MWQKKAFSYYKAVNLDYFKFCKRIVSYFNPVIILTEKNTENQKKCNCSSGVWPSLFTGCIKSNWPFVYSPGRGWLETQFGVVLCCPGVYGSQFQLLPKDCNTVCILKKKTQNKQKRTRNKQRKPYYYILN